MNTLSVIIEILSFLWDIIVILGVIGLIFVSGFGVVLIFGYAFAYGISYFQDKEGWISQNKLIVSHIKALHPKHVISVLKQKKQLHRWRKPKQSLDNMVKDIRKTLKYNTFNSDKPRYIFSKILHFDYLYKDNPFFYGSLLLKYENSLKVIEETLHFIKEEKQVIKEELWNEMLELVDIINKDFDKIYSLIEKNSSLEKEMNMTLIEKKVKQELKVIKELKEYGFM